MKDIAVLCTTRNRPEKVEELYKSWEFTNFTFSDFYIAIDEDDTSVYPEGINKIVCPTPNVRGMGPSTNFAALKLSKQYRYILWVGDDHRFRSGYWDINFIEAISDMGGTGFVYANDLLQGENLPTQCMMSSNIIKALGYMIPPDFNHLFIDNFWLTLGRAIGKITYLRHVIIEHMHPAAGKAEWDSQYHEINVNDAHDKQAFQTWHDTQMREDIAKLKTL